MIELDGSYGEGGGAILRQALALSAYTGKAFHINNIRANRSTPGLKMQHLHALNAAQRLCSAEVEGNHEGSTEITFKPGKIEACDIKVDIGTAGSITLLLQSLILPCVFSKKRFTIEVTGGTDVKWSQPIDYFINVFLPQMKKYAKIECNLIRRGYFPKGQGHVKISISGKGNPSKPVEIKERKQLLQIKGVSHASRDLEESGVADRQSKNAELILKTHGAPVNIAREYVKTESTGSGITLWAIFGSDEGIDFENPVILGADSLGEPSKKAELVGEEAAFALQKALDSEAPVDHYLADQLVSFIAIAGGEIKVQSITDHTLSNVYVAENFLDINFEMENNIIKLV